MPEDDLKNVLSQLSEAEASSVLESLAGGSASTREDLKNALSKLKSVEASQALESLAEGTSASPTNEPLYAPSAPEASDMPNAEAPPPSYNEAMRFVRHVPKKAEQFGRRLSVKKT